MQFSLYSPTWQSATQSADGSKNAACAEEANKTADTSSTSDDDAQLGGRRRRGLLRTDGDGGASLIRRSRLPAIVSAILSVLKACARAPMRGQPSRNCEGRKGNYIGVVEAWTSQQCGRFLGAELECGANLPTALGSVFKPPLPPFAGILVLHWYYII
jgi:hypothetical protein